MADKIIYHLVDLGDIALRSFLSLVVLFLITRMMGKKQISQLTFFDYVIGISIGSLAAAMAATDDIPYEHALTAIVVYGILAWLIALITNKSILARRFFTGHTFLLIDRGKILEKNLSLVKFDVNDLLSEARNAGYFNVADIEYALLETNGKISFLPKAAKQPLTCGDMNIQKPQDGLTANVIIDGVIMAENLKMTGLTEEWLKSELSKQRINNIARVILATVDSSRTLSVYLKTGSPVKKTVID